MEKVTELFCFQVALKFVKRNSVSEYKKVSKCHNHNIYKHNNNKKATTRIFERSQVLFYFETIKKCNLKFQLIWFIS